MPLMPVVLKMPKYRIYSIIGIAVIVFFNLPSITAECSDDYFEAVGACFLKNSNCPDNSIFFNNTCHNILQGDCNTTEIWINDKCCKLSCMSYCTDGNCENCCSSKAIAETPITNYPIQSVTPCPIVSIPPISGCPNQPIIYCPIVLMYPIPPASGCPNQPITPCPIVPINPTPPTSGCSNQPVTPYPIPPTSVTVTPYPIEPINPTPPTSGCPNQPVTPFPIEPINPTPYPIEPINPIPPTTECPNQPVTPYPVVPINPTPSTSDKNQTVTPSPVEPINPTPPTSVPNQTVTPSPVEPNYPTPPTSVPNQTVTPSPLAPTNPPMTSTTTLATPTASTTTTTARPTVTTALPPDPLIQCPPGTILVGRTCHLIYCPRGSVMKNNHCVVVGCPEGTVWTGHRCTLPEPMAQNLTFSNTVVTNFNHTKPDIILNTANNIIVNASMTLPEDSSLNNCSYEDKDCATTPSPTTPIKCCEVITPRICEARNNRWHCYSRRYRRCGDFCIKPIIYLRPTRIQARPNCVVMPPLKQDCESHKNCGELTGGSDCSGCAMGDMERCSYYCYRYACPSQKCEFYDQKEYCLTNGGSHGCQEEDGCYDDWCQ